MTSFKNGNAREVLKNILTDVDFYELPAMPKEKYKPPIPFREKQKIIKERAEKINSKL